MVDENTDEKTGSEDKENKETSQESEENKIEESEEINSSETDEEPEIDDAKDEDEPGKGIIEDPSLISENPQTSGPASTVPPPKPEEQSTSDPNNTSNDEENDNEEKEVKLPEDLTKIHKTAPTEKIIQRVVDEEMKDSYLAYSMSVIVGRALPDVRDGLKPVHRRILFAMNEIGLVHNKPYKKSARIVGEVLGKYHPHGDTAVYDSMVRMAQTFSLRYPLVQGQGNFGSVDGDSPAAMRYTEARLDIKAEELLQDIDKNTVDFQPNFDASLKEPTVLPGKLPNLLINGSSGIAVGMATNIPPHNVSEIIDASIKMIDNPESTILELMELVKGPDFPTAGIICGTFGIKEAYTTGKGRVIVRAKTEIEEKKNKKQIIITEIPYMVNKSMLIEHIADLIRSKSLTGISGLKDLSDRQGMRIVIELKSEANEQIVLNQLFKHSRLQVTFGINMLALVNNEPKVLNLKQMIEYYILHRRKVVRRRTEFELKKAEDRAHILEGLIIALNNIDDVVRKIKASKDVNEAKSMLIDDYSLTEIQAKAILDMRLQKLASLEREKINTEHKELMVLIEELKSILASEQRILDIIKKELTELREKYGDDRRTMITEEAATDIDVEDLIEEEQMVITISNQGYIKRLPIDTYRKQRRGGRGIIGATAKEEDFIEHLFTASTHSYILIFTNKGRVYWLKVYNIPEGSRQSKGKPLVNLLNLSKAETVNAVVPVKEFDDQHYLFLATRRGVVKKTNLKAYSNPRTGGIIAIDLDSEDELINAELTDGNRDIMIVTRNGMAIKFHEKDARPIGRTSRGVRGIMLRNDEVVGMQIVTNDKYLLTITENGFGKKTSISDYRHTARGGVGVINIKTSDRNGKVVSVMSVYNDNDVIVISQKGIIIRTSAKSISTIGRATQGVRIMKLDSGDKVMAAEKIKVENNGTDNDSHDPDETPALEETDEEAEEGPEEETPKEEEPKEESEPQETEESVEPETEQDSPEIEPDGTDR